MEQDDNGAYGASNMPRIVQCGGFPSLLNSCAKGGMIFENSSKSLQESAAVKWALKKALTGETVKLGDVSDNSIPVDREMIETIELVKTTLVEWRYDRVYQPIDGGAICKEVQGSPLYSHVENDEMRIVQLKYGHRFVDVFENWEMLAYAVGNSGGYYPKMRYAMTIIQPRNYHGGAEPVRTWTISADELRGYADKLRAACAKSFGPIAPCVIGPECMGCAVRHHCHSALNAEDGAFDLIGENQPLIYTDAALSLRLRNVKRAIEHLKAMESGLTAEAAHRIANGGNIPGWAMQSSPGKKQWSVPDSEVVAMAEMLGFDVKKPTAAITPTQAEKNGMPADIVAAFSKRSTGEPELKRIDTAKIWETYANFN